MSTVTIYNLGGKEQLGTVNLHHAIKMIHRGVARVHTADPEGIRYGPYEKPVAVELLRYVFAKWFYSQTGKTLYSKAGVLKRDKYVCAYCKSHGETIDHITPRCQGGLTEWENVITACKSCNMKKAGRTPEQAGMKMHFKPFTPSVAQIYSYR